MSGEMDPFVAEVLATPGGKNVLQCYQCGTCSGSCPVLEDMTYGPRALMHMIQMGMKDEVLSCHDMWYCVSCYSCASRCPRGIEVTDLMAELRRMALAQGYAVDKEAEFGEAFAETVKRHGRMFEPELMVRYYLRVLDVLSLLKMVPLGIQMILKGKLPFWPEPVKSPAASMDPLYSRPTAVIPPAATLLTKTFAKGRKPTHDMLAGPLLALGAVCALLVGALWFLRKEKGR